MHYYSFNIKEFRAGTFQMTRQERWIYRDMLDIIYDTEQPLPDNLDKICVMLGVRTDDEKRIVADLLLYKFTQVDGGYMNHRAEQEIHEYHNGLEKASAAGKASAAKRAAQKQQKINEIKASDDVELNKTQTYEQHESNERSTIVEQALNECSTNQEPITSNQDKTPQPPDGGQQTKERKARGKAILLADYLSDCKQKNIKPIPETCEVFSYAESSGIPNEFLRLQWLEFRDRYTAADCSKRYTRWTSVFTRSVRDNWYKLWYHDSRSGEYALTTTGIQAQKTHKGK